MQPIRRQIQSISNGFPAIITTTDPHGYLPGLYVRINLDGGFGMEDLNGQQFLIGDITANSFSIPINTISFTPFITGQANITALQNTNPGNVIVDSPQFVPGQKVIVTGVDPLFAISTLNGNSFKVLSVQFGTLIRLNVDLSSFPLYIGAGLIRNLQVPQVIPIAEIAGTLQNAVKNNLTPIGGFQ